MTVKVERVRCGAKGVSGARQGLDICSQLPSQLMICKSMTSPFSRT